MNGQPARPTFLTLRLLLSPPSGKEEFTARAPVCLPDVQRLLVHVVVLQRLLVQEVKEVFDGRRNDGVRAQHAAEEIVYELLQRALQESGEGVFTP